MASSSSFSSLSVSVTAGHRSHNLCSSSDSWHIFLPKQQNSLTEGMSGKHRAEKKVSLTLVSRRRQQRTSTTTTTARTEFETKEKRISSSAAVVTLSFRFSVFHFLLLLLFFCSACHSLPDFEMESISAHVNVSLTQCVSGVLAALLRPRVVLFYSPLFCSLRKPPPSPLAERLLD